MQSFLQSFSFIFKSMTWSRFLTSSCNRRLALSTNRLYSAKFSNCSVFLAYNSLSFEFKGIEINSTSFCSGNANMLFSTSMQPSSRSSGTKPDFNPFGGNPCTSRTIKGIRFWSKFLTCNEIWHWVSMKLIRTEFELLTEWTPLMLSSFVAIGENFALQSNGRLINWFLLVLHCKTFPLSLIGIKISPACRVLLLLLFLMTKLSRTKTRMFRRRESSKTFSKDRVALPSSDSSSKNPP